MKRGQEARRTEEARRAAKAQRAADAQREAEARLRWNSFERVSDGVLDRQQDVVWATADNGRDINWQDAMSYCRSLGAGWSLPRVNQLESLFAGDTPFSQSISGSTIYPATNMIRFTGLWLWSAEGNDSSGALGVHLAAGSQAAYRQSHGRGNRALCVRRP